MAQSAGPSAQAAWRRMAARWMELLFPAPCAGCGAPLRGAPNPWFCGACWEGLALAPDDGCARCGLPFAAEAARVQADWQCGDCRRRPPAFDLARTLGPYDGALAEGVRLLKYRDQTGLARALVARLVPERFPSALWEVDLVAPVPLHPSRLRARGYNQAAWLARALAGVLEVPVGDVLERTTATPPQVGLTRPARARNVRGAFRVPAPERVAGRAVLLVDDVITTGATAAACARALKMAGAVRVQAWAVARQGLD